MDDLETHDGLIGKYDEMARAKVAGSLRAKEQPHARSASKGLNYSKEELKKYGSACECRPGKKVPRHGEPREGGVYNARLVSRNFDFGNRARNLARSLGNGKKGTKQGPKREENRYPSKKHCEFQKELRHKEFSKTTKGKRDREQRNRLVADCRFCGCHCRQSRDDSGNSPAEKCEYSLFPVQRPTKLYDGEGRVRAELTAVYSRTPDDKRFGEKPYTDAKGIRINYGIRKKMKPSGTEGPKYFVFAFNVIVRPEDINSDKIPEDDRKKNYAFSGWVIESNLKDSYRLKKNGRRKLWYIKQCDTRRYAGGKESRHEIIGLRAGEWSKQWRRMTAKGWKRGDKLPKHLPGGAATDYLARTPDNACPEGYVSLNQNLKGFGSVANDIFPADRGVKFHRIKEKPGDSTRLMVSEWCVPYPLDGSKPHRSASRKAKRFWFCYGYVEDKDANKRYGWIARDALKPAPMLPKKTTPSR